MGPLSERRRDEQGISQWRGPSHPSGHKSPGWGPRQETGEQEDEEPGERNEGLCGGGIRRWEVALVAWAYAKSTEDAKEMVL